MNDMEGNDGEDRTRREVKHLPPPSSSQRHRVVGLLSSVVLTGSAAHYQLNATQDYCIDYITKYTASSRVPGALACALQRERKQTKSADSVLLATTLSPATHVKLHHRPPDGSRVYEFTFVTL